MMPATQTDLSARIARHQDELRAFLRRRAPDMAEELCQETWLRVARADPYCADDAAFRAYAFTVARRVLIDHHRRRLARVQLVQVEPGDEARLGNASPPDSAIGAEQVLVAVEAELARMHPEIAQVFRWRTTEDLSFKDIAARQGVPLNTALGRMHRAVKRLYAALLEGGLLPEGSRGPT